MAKVQFNCRLDEDVVKWIAEEAERRSVNGKKFSQADVVTVLVGSAENVEPRKPPETKTEKTKAMDLVGRRDQELARLVE